MDSSTSNSYSDYPVDQSANLDFLSLNADPDLCYQPTYPLAESDCFANKNGAADKQAITAAH